MIGSEVEALCSLLKAHGDKVLSGGHRLALTAALVQKVSAAFSLLVASTGADLHDFQVVPASSNSRLNDLHFLHDFLQRVDALVVSHGADTLQGDVDIAKFRNLKYVFVNNNLHAIYSAPLFLLPFKAYLFRISLLFISLCFLVLS